MGRYRQFALALGVLSAMLAACGGSNTVITEPVVVATATPPAWSGVPAFSAQSTLLAAPTVALPRGGGFTGTLGTNAAILSYTELTETLQSAQPQIAPLARRKAADLSAAQILSYIGLLYDATLPASSFTLTLGIPAAAVLPGTRYYIALYDPNRPTLGWQRGFAGPALPTNVNGTPTLTFTAEAPAFERYTQYWLATYMISSSDSAPTIAPSISPLASPTPLPQSLINLQNSVTKSCSGECATGKPSPQVSEPATITNAVASPSLSGSSTELQVVPVANAAGDVLYYTPSLGSFPLATHFTWDFWFMIDQPVWDAVAHKPLALGALEFDFNEYMPFYDYNFSSQCVLRDPNFNPSGPVWQIWGKSGTSTGWIDSGVVCHPETYFTPNVWHHIVWSYQIFPDSLQTQYLSLTIDGLPQPGLSLSLNPVQARDSTRPALEVQFQQDARALASPSPFREWVDNVTLTLW